MSDNYTPKNYGLFGKYIAKISKVIISKLGSRENIITFIEELCRCGDVGLAAEKTLKNLISPLLLHKVINSDRNLSKCVNLAINNAAGMAEAMLYDRAINDKRADQGGTFVDQLRLAESEGRITHLPYDSAYKVNTYWDIGIVDYTVIWFACTKHVRHAS